MNKTSFWLMIPTARWCQTEYHNGHGIMNDFGYLVRIDFTALAYFINGNGEMAV